MTTTTKHEKRKELGMVRANDDLRKRIEAAGIKQWQLAEKLNVSEFTLSRRFRHELPEEEKQRIETAIREMNQ